MDKKEFSNLKDILSGKEPEKKIQVGFGSQGREGTSTDKPDGTIKTIGDKKYIAVNGTWRKYQKGKTFHYTNKEGKQVSVGETKQYGVPLLCPECGALMKGNKDKKSWYQHGSCLNCLVDYHHKLQKLGKFEQFAFRKRLLSAISYHKEQENQFEDFKKLATENPEYVHSNGTIDRWKNDLDSEKMIEEYRNYLDEYKEKLNESIEKYENEYGESLNDWEEPE